jgi:hypothetical protein
VSIKRGYEIKAEEIPDRPAQSATRAVRKPKVIQRAKGVVVHGRIADCKKNQRHDPDQGFFPLPEPLKIVFSLKALHYNCLITMKIKYKLKFI